MSFSRETIERAMRIALPIAREIETLNADTGFTEYVEPHCVGESTVIAQPNNDSDDDIELSDNTTHTYSFEEALAYSSAKIGQMGENEIFESLAARFKFVEKTCYKPHSGDITIKCDQWKVMAEVKSYSAYVPQAQIDKFKRDLRETGAQAGLFISIRSRIVRMHDDILLTHEHIGRFVPVIYLIMPTSAMVNTAVVLLCQLLGALEYINSVAAAHEEGIQKLLSIDGIHQDISASRQKLLDSLGDFTNKITTIAGDISNSELKLHSVIASAGLTADIYGDSFANELRLHPKFDSYKNVLKGFIIEIISKIHSRVPKIVENVWKNTNNRYIHVQTGISLRLLANKAELILPGGIVAENTILSLLRTNAKNVSISNTVSIEINSDTIKTIKDIL